MQCRLLFDECIPFALVQGLRYHCPNSDIAQVGETGLPLKGTLDSELLLFCEAQHRILVSGDRSTLSRHVSVHRTAGHDTYGIAVICPGHSFVDVIEDLALVLECSSADEWINDFVYVPSLARG